ncbi:MAG: TIGR03936 family radical SAM-associated protein [Spirochaetota bacterium]
MNTRHTEPTHHTGHAGHTATTSGRGASATTSGRRASARVVIPRETLLAVESPGRYVGGEYGSLEPLESWDHLYVVALCFPDLYEIGMSNTAIKLLYTLLNQSDGVRCERVFTPAPDFEAALRASGTPLYTLESRIPLSECDMVAFSVGYELSATNVLNVLDLGGIPIRAEDRCSDDPLVIAGGPALINPAPFGGFFDGVFIGEAEGTLTQMVTTLKDTPQRRDAVAHLREDPHVWTRENPTARRAIWNDFGVSPVKIRFPVPSIRVVQDHATVEIMRGCPQGCRFCSAGVLYRPYRMKPFEVVEEEVDHLVHALGYRTITLSSLSSGDYEGIYDLYVRLNERFAGDRVAFALPSLRVNSMTLPLLEQVNQVRKSGLTFAVETAGEAGQRALNKMVPVEASVRILQEAQERGWRHAKLYFMIGLPIPSDNEIEEILDYVDELRSKTSLSYNVAVATFVPKPHTPFQWERQLTEEESLERIMALKHALRRRKIKLGYQAPFHSVLEGLVARGDADVGAVLEEAFRRGARLDAWEEHIDRDLWRSVLAEAGSGLPDRILAPRDPESPLPWDGVKLGVSPGTLRRERRRAREGRLTEQCSPDCRDRCGVCNARVAARTLSARTANRRGAVPRDPARSGGTPPPGEAAHASPPPTERRPQQVLQQPPRQPDHDEGVDQPRPAGIPYILRFAKEGTAVYVPHLSVVNTFGRALLRAGIPVEYTRGFHPKPRLEFAQPLSTGVAGREELVRLWVSNSIHPKTLSQRLTEALPPGMRVIDAWPHSNDSKHARAKLMSVYWGGVYRIEGHISPELRDYLKTAPEVVRCEDEVTPEAGNPASGEPAPQVGTATETADAVIITVDRSRGSGRGLTKLLEGALGDHPVRRGVSVTRLRSYAKDPKTREPVSFRERFPEKPPA